MNKLNPQDPQKPNIWFQGVSYLALWLFSVAVMGVAVGIAVPRSVLPLVLKISDSPADFIDSADIILFAHRGGVYLPGVPDNSLTSLEAAIRRGYRGVEVDLRETKDHVVIAHHDAGFERYFGSACEVAGFYVCRDKNYGDCAVRARNSGQKLCHVDHLTIQEIRQLTGKDGETQVPLFEEYIARVAASRMEIMLDFKQVFSDVAIHSVAALLDKHREHFPAVYFIGVLQPKLKLSRKDLGQFGIVRALHPFLVATGILQPHKFFVFQNGINTGPGDVVYAQLVGADLVPSINWKHIGGFSFLDDADEDGDIDLADLVLQAQQKILELYRLGVRKFQIDSDFDAVAFPEIVADDV